MTAAPTYDEALSLYREKRDALDVTLAAIANPEPADDLHVMLAAWRHYLTTGSAVARDVALALADANRTGSPRRALAEAEMME